MSSDGGLGVCPACNLPQGCRNLAAFPSGSHPRGWHQPHSALFPVLQAKESIEQLVYLCQTDKEPVREAAKQSLMLCGECPASPHGTLPKGDRGLG